MSAIVPATCGAAMDVPPFTTSPPPRFEEAMVAPGASRSTEASLFEKQATWSTCASATVQYVVCGPELSYVAPTLSTWDIQAGKVVAVSEPSLPLDAVISTPR